MRTVQGATNGMPSVLADTCILSQHGYGRKARGARRCNHKPRFPHAAQRKSHFLHFTKKLQGTSQTHHEALHITASDCIAIEVGVKLLPCFGHVDHSVRCPSAATGHSTLLDTRRQRGQTHEFCIAAGYWPTSCARRRRRTNRVRGQHHVHHNRRGVISATDLSGRHRRRSASSGSLRRPCRG